MGLYSIPNSIESVRAREISRATSYPRTVASELGMLRFTVNL
jgi:hypothetical protein